MIRIMRAGHFAIIAACLLPGTSLGVTEVNVEILRRGVDPRVLEWIDYGKALNVRGDHEKSIEALTQLVAQIQNSENCDPRAVVVGQLGILEGEALRGDGGGMAVGVENLRISVDKLKIEGDKGDTLLSIYPLLRKANQEGVFSDSDFVLFLVHLFDTWGHETNADEVGMLYQAGGDLSILLVEQGNHEKAMEIANASLGKWAGEQRRDHFDAMRKASLAVVGAGILQDSEDKGVLESEPERRDMLIGTLLLAHSFKLAGEGDKRGNLLAGELMGAEHLQAGGESYEGDLNQDQFVVDAFGSAGDFFRDAGNTELHTLFEKETKTLSRMVESEKYWWVPFLVILGVFLVFVVVFVLPVSWILGSVNRRKVAKIEAFLHSTIQTHLPTPKHT